MHQQMRDQLERVLAGPVDSPGFERCREHLEQCAECREEFSAMRDHAALLRAWKAPAEVEPRPGFYARVMERIEAQSAGSIWNLFFDSAYGRRIAIASMALAILIGAYLVTAEERAGDMITMAGNSAVTVPSQSSPAPMPSGVFPAADTVAVQEDGPAMVLTGIPDQDSVLVNLVTYREQ